MRPVASGLGRFCSWHVSVVVRDIGARGCGFNSWAGQIGHSVATTTTRVALVGGLAPLVLKQLFVSGARGAFEIGQVLVNVCLDFRAEVLKPGGASGT